MKLLAHRYRIVFAAVLAAAGTAAPSHLVAQGSAPPAAVTFTSFGSRLLSAAVARRGAADSNTVLSPVSAGLVLSLASLGAEGSTATALANALGTAGVSRAELERQGATLLSASSDRSDVQLEIANALWTDSSVSLLKSFDASAGVWRAAVRSLRLHSPSARDAINHWTDSATHGKIKSILDGPLPDTTLLFMENAVYFKGKWDRPFVKSMTKSRQFTLLSGRKIMVPSMTSTGMMQYRRNDGYQILRLPYAGNHVAMYIILPDSGSEGKLEQQFADHGWPASFRDRAGEEVHLVLPRFHVEQEIGLQPLITRLGAGIAFDCDRANFRNMVVQRNGEPVRSFCIGSAVQKVYIDVDEEGTEAAAVTGLGMATATAARIPIEFVVDRPFLIVLRDESSGADLFVGSIRHP